MSESRDKNRHRIPMPLGCKVWLTEPRQKRFARPLLGKVPICKIHEQPLLECVLDKTQEENERLLYWLKRWYDMSGSSIATSAAIELSSQAEHLLGEHTGKKDLVFCGYCQSSTSAGTGTEGTPTVHEAAPVRPGARMPGNGVQEEAKSAPPKAEAGDTPKDLTGFITGNMSCPWSEPKYEHHTMRIDKCTVCGKPLAVKSVFVFLARGGETPGPKPKVEDE